MLAPAGDLEKLKIAVDYGADAVYFGGEMFSLRAGAGNLSTDEIREGVRYEMCIRDSAWSLAEMILEDCMNKNMKDWNGMKTAVREGLRRYIYNKTKRNPIKMCIRDSFHTTGRAGMSKLEKIIFLADAIEPGRNYPTVDEIRKLAYVDLDEACIASMERTVQYTRKKGEYLDPDTIDALNDLKEKRNV